MPDILVVLPCTAPLRRKVDVNMCIDILLKKGYQGVVAITKAKKSPYFNMVKKKPDQQIKLFSKSNKIIYRRQDAPDVFEITTNCYVFKTLYVINNENLFSGKIYGFEVPHQSTIDIDTKNDFQIAKFFMEK